MWTSRFLREFLAHLNTSEPVAIWVCPKTMNLPWIQNILVLKPSTSWYHFISRCWSHILFPWFSRNRLFWNHHSIIDGFISCNPPLPWLNAAQNPNLSRCAAASKLHGVCNRHSFPVAAEALGGFGGMFRRMSILILLIFVYYWYYYVRYYCYYWYYYYWYYYCYWLYNDHQ